MCDAHYVQSMNNAYVIYLDKRSITMIISMYIDGEKGGTLVLHKLLCGLNLCL